MAWENGLTVYEVELLMRAYYAGEGLASHPEFDELAFNVAHDNLKAQGLIFDYRATPKGECYVRALMRIPLPVQTWAVQTTP